MVARPWTSNLDALARVCCDPAWPPFPLHPTAERIEQIKLQAPKVNDW